MKLLGSLKAKAQSYLDPYQQKDPATYAAAQQAVGGLLILDGFIGIDNPLQGKKRPGIFGTLGGIVLGVVFMFVPSFFNSVTGINKMTATTSATVAAVGAPVVSRSSNQNSSNTSNSSNSSACSLTAKYTVDGKDYTKQSAASSSSNCSMSQGQAFTINYDPQNPGSWASDVKTLGLVMSLFFWAGLVVVLTSIVTFFIRLLSIIYGWKILKSGRALAATLPAGTDLNTMINEIKQHFTGSLFNFGGAAPPVPPTIQYPPATPPQAPTV